MLYALLVDTGTPHNHDGRADRDHFHATHPEVEAMLMHALSGGKPPGEALAGMQAAVLLYEREYDADTEAWGRGEKPTGRRTTLTGAAGMSPERQPRAQGARHHHGGPVMAVISPLKAALDAASPKAVPVGAADAVGAAKASAADEEVNWATMLTPS